MKVSFKGYVSITCVSGSYLFDAKKMGTHYTSRCPYVGFESILTVSGDGIHSTHWNPDINDNETDKPFSFSILFKAKEQAKKLFEFIKSAQEQDDQGFEIKLNDEGLIDTVKDTRKNKILIKDGRLNAFC